MKARGALGIGSAGGPTLGAVDVGEGRSQRVEVPTALRLWASLAEVEPAESSLVVAERRDLAWLGVALPAETIVGGGFGPGLRSSSVAVANKVAERPDVGRLARLDALHDNEYLLRLCWVLVVGTLKKDGRRSPVIQPLLTRPVSIRRRNLLQRAATGSLYEGADEHHMELHGEAELNRLVEDSGLRSHLGGVAEFGGGSLGGSGRSADDRLLRRLHRLRQWIRDVGDAMGLPVEHMTMSPPDWDTALSKDGLRAHVGSALYIARDPGEVSVASSLLNWAGRKGVESTALATILSRCDAGAPEPIPQTSPVLLPMPLSASQEHVVRTARNSAVTVLSGAPGTGKTHTLCAVAVDSVAHGRGVLIATHSRAAADAVTELLDRTPGPDPVRFGEGSGIARVIDELEQRRAAPLQHDQVERLRSRAIAALARRDAIRDGILYSLQVEATAADGVEWAAALPALRHDAPLLFDPVVDLAVAGELLEEAERTGGWWAGRRTRRAMARLRALAGAGPEVQAPRLAAAISAAGSRRAMAELSLGGGTRLDDQWEVLVEAESAARVAQGEWLEALPHDPARLRSGGATAVSDLLTALRAGREARRDLLTSLPAGALTAVAPLWVGTLGDIEDVLPAVPGLFDLVILDEASHIEQSRAAGALLRGRRALVVGDPRQLRHTSFMSDERIDAALDEMGLTESRAVLDVRRVTAFDLAAAVGEPIQLREHFRSEPHLIGFSLSHFYRDQVAIMTTSPRTESTDCIDVIEVPPVHSDATSHDSPIDGDAEPDTQGGAEGDPELDAVVRVVDRLVGEGTVDIGVITPFAEQARRLERLLGDRFDAEEIRRIRLRVGTVHGFQGAERDVMVIAPGLHADGPAGRRRFAEDPHLFNVMVTRARHRCIVTTSLGSDGKGLFGAYLRYADRGPQPPACAPPEDRWTGALAEGLAAAGLDVRTSYPVGPWTVDLVVGNGDTAVGLETRVHPDGPLEHMTRRLALGGLGWRLTDAYPSRWDGDAARAAVELAGDLASLAARA